MKLGFLDAAGHPGNQHSGFGERAFTLNEVMVAMAILLMAVAGVMMCQWFGMIMTERTRGKVDANDRASEFLHYELAELKKMHIHALISGADDAPRLVELFRQVVFF